MCVCVCVFVCVCTWEDNIKIDPKEIWYDEAE
jgi:hypothetical protein